MAEEIEAKENLFREICLLCYIRAYGPSACGDLWRRALFTEIGAISGHVSLLDQGFAKDHGLEPLTEGERWILSPLVEQEKAYRWEVFRQACLEVLGEDIEENPLI